MKKKFVLAIVVLYCGLAHAQFVTPGGGSTTINDSGTGASDILSAAKIYEQLALKQATLGASVNITVGTISAGASGFSVDADGDVTAKSVNIAKTSGTAGQSCLYQANSTDTYGVCDVGPATKTSAYNLNFIRPSAEPTANQVKIYSAPDGSHNVTESYAEAIIPGTTVITKSEYVPIRYAEDDDSVTAPAAAAEIGTTTLIARSFAEDADNGVVIWWQIPIDYSAGIKFRVYFATDTNASANETAVFNLSGCAMASSGALACSEGTGQEAVLELTTNEDTGELLVTGWSAAITIGGSPAAGQMAKLLLIRDVAGGTTEDDMAGHALVTGIEIKYQAKVNASGDY